jgi:hypothetical protein
MNPMQTKRDPELAEPDPVRENPGTREESLWEILFSKFQDTPDSAQPGFAPAGAKPVAPRRRLRKKRRKIAGVVVGRLAGRNETGQPLVSFPESPTKQPLPARSMIRWTEADLGKDVVLMFEDGQPRKPMLMGFLQVARPEPVPQPLPVQAQMDGEKLVFTADQEIVLRCGQASLTLTRAGKILLSGTYLLSRSSGVNRIKGGSVQIN